MVAASPWSEQSSPTPVEETTTRHQEDFGWRIPLHVRVGDGGPPGQGRRPDLRRVVDAALAADPYSRVAVETLLTTGLVVVAGEITTKSAMDFAAIAGEVICEIGYDTGEFGFDGNAVGVIIALDRQSADIARGVDDSHDRVTGGAPTRLTPRAPATRA